MTRATPMMVQRSSLRERVSWSHRMPSGVEIRMPSWESVKPVPAPSLLELSWSSRMAMPHRTPLTIEGTMRR